MWQADVQIPATNLPEQRESLCIWAPQSQAADVWQLAALWRAQGACYLWPGFPNKGKYLGLSKLDT